MKTIKKIILEIYNRKLEKSQYMPWRNNDYQGLFKRSNNRISQIRAYRMLQLLQAIKEIEGDVCEMGVYKGGTAYLLADLISNMKMKKKIFLFDTFTGTPKTTQKDNIERAGSYSSTNLDEVKNHLSLFSGIIEYRPGIIPDSFSNIEIGKVCFANIHLNVYEATYFTLDFVFEKMPIGGIILVQDYGNKRCLGVKKAVDEFFVQKKSCPIYLGNKQSVIFKID